VSPSLPAVHADGERIVQVLANLLRNAIKFTPSGGRITVAAMRDGDAVTFSVTDTGRGIPAEHLTRIFDRYWQSSNGARARGTGLGLSIAKGIVEAHGGSIAVRSTPGTGTTVQFTIPE
jgi:signal transduction histidine kinase